MNSERVIDHLRLGWCNSKSIREVEMLSSILHNPRFIERGNEGFCVWRGLHFLSNSIEVTIHDQVQDIVTLRVMINNSRKVDLSLLEPNVVKLGSYYMITDSSFLSVVGYYTMLIDLLNDESYTHAFSNYMTILTYNTHSLKLLLFPSRVRTSSEKILDIADHRQYPATQQRTRYKAYYKDTAKSIPTLVNINHLSGMSEPQHSGDIRSPDGNPIDITSSNTIL